MSMESKRNNIIILSLNKAPGGNLLPVLFNTIKTGQIIRSVPFFIILKRTGQN
jgi:hypothetical protein